MKRTYTYHIMFPYSNFVKHPNYRAMNDLICNRFLSTEDIEKIWDVEFLYPTGKPHSWYEANEWWSTEKLYEEFRSIDGRVDYEQPAFVNGKQLMSNVIYKFECVEDDEIDGRWYNRIIKSRICGINGWRTVKQCN